LDIVLGMSMAPASIQMVVVEGENADGATVEEDEFDVTAADDAATASAPEPENDPPMVGTGCRGSEV